VETEPIHSKFSVVARAQKENHPACNPKAASPPKPGRKVIPFLFRASFFLRRPFRKLTLGDRENKSPSDDCGAGRLSFRALKGRARGKSTNEWGDDPKIINRSQGLILGIITLSHVISSFSNLSIPPLTPFLQEELHLTYTQVGFLTSAFYTGVVCASIPAGWVTDLLGERRALALGLGIQGAFILSFATIHDLFIGGLFLFLAGIGYCSVNPATTKIVMTYFPSPGRATAMGIKQTGIPLGGILAALLLPGLAITFGWRISIVGVGLATGLFLCLPWFLMPSIPEVKSQRVQVRWVQLWEVFSNREILALSIMNLFLAGVQLSIVTYLVLFLKSNFFFSSILAGFYLAACQMGGTAGRVCWGLISDFLLKGKRKSTLLSISIIAAGQLFLLGRIGPDVPGVLIFLMIFLLGFTTVGFHGVLLSLLGELADRKLVGLTMGFSMTITFSGVILFPPFFGHIVDRLGSYTPAWDFLAWAYVAALLILIFLVREKQAETNTAGGI
jgi:ACS family hexuronate transporter-like MFS transporter